MLDGAYDDASAVNKAQLASQSAACKQCALCIPCKAHAAGRQLEDDDDDDDEDDDEDAV